jgi:hypothetical protein
LRTIGYGSKTREAQGLTFAGPTFAGPTFTGLTFTGLTFTGLTFAVLTFAVLTLIFPVSRLDAGAYSGISTAV